MNFKSVAADAIDKEKDQLRLVSNEIWQHPEICFQEHHAVATLTDFLRKRGFAVTPQYCGLETAFKAEVSNKKEGKEGIHVCVICEYDALPEIGHACGHNLIAEAGVAAGLGLQAALQQGLIGHVTVMGTPAEEDGGGKAILIDHGAFKDIDIAMMVHPGPKNILAPTYDAMIELYITYTGKAAHAAAFPWEGVNALDAAVIAYTSLSTLRQQLKPTWQLHGVIVDGGVKPNIIPERSKLFYYLRAPTTTELKILKEKVYMCFKAASTATGCSVVIEDECASDNLMTNCVLLEHYKTNIEKFGVKEFHEPLVKMGSTDMGNVSHVVPSIHPEYVIGSGENYHTREFTSVTNLLASHEKTLEAAKALAFTCIDVMSSQELLKKIKEQFEQDKLVVKK